MGFKWAWARQLTVGQNPFWTVVQGKRPQDTRGFLGKSQCSSLQGLKFKNISVGQRVLALYIRYIGSSYMPIHLIPRSTFVCVRERGNGENWESEISDGGIWEAGEGRGRDVREGVQSEREGNRKDCGTEEDTPPWGRWGCSSDHSPWGLLASHVIPRSPCRQVFFILFLSFLSVSIGFSNFRFGVSFWIHFRVFFDGILRILCSVLL